MLMDIDNFEDTFKDKDNFPPVPAKTDSNTAKYAYLTTEEREINKMVSLCKELDIAPLNLDKYKIPSEILWFVPEDIVRAHNVMPVAQFGLVLTLAVSDPFDIVAFDTIADYNKLNIQLVLTVPSQINRAIEENFSSKEPEKTELFLDEPRKGAVDLKEITELSHKAQIVDIVNNILIEGLNSRASDVHIESFPGTLRVRYRIDGVLQERKTAIDKNDERAIIARLKIMSKLDITQRRLPQDGRISLTLNSREIDLRVSILPTSAGEKVVLRVLEKGSLQVNLEKLGFSAYAFEAFKKVSSRPHGMMIITGPTGSGKSTTLYAILNRLNNSEKNIITIEDPVEYQMKNITQIQVKSDIGLTFANILRAVLRQNPDIVMVGEMRDFETADIAIKSALTGHLMLSTLHTNDAPTAIVRLMNMGIEAFLIATTMTLIAAQRLCRKICPKCKEGTETSVAKLSGLPKDFTADKAILYRGKGCESCNFTGYFGRVAVVEALIIDDHIRDLIIKKATLTAIREYARSQGMRTLREDAVEKCLAGDISLEEVLRVTPEA